MSNFYNDKPAFEHHVLHYAISLPLPDTLANRPVEHLQERPDLVDKFKLLIDQLEQTNHGLCEGNFAVGFDEISNKSIEVHYELKRDRNAFLDTWPYEFEKIKMKLPKYAVTWLDSIES